MEKEPKSTKVGNKYPMATSDQAINFSRVTCVPSVRMSAGRKNPLFNWLRSIDRWRLKSGFHRKPVILSGSATSTISPEKEYLQFLLVVIAYFALTPVGFALADRQNPTWQKIEPGLELATFPAPGKVQLSTASSIRILRINPAHFEFRLLNASQMKKGKPLSARKWSHRHELVAAINASMYQRDHMTSVSYMKNGKHVNNTWFSKDKALLAFDPSSPALPPVQILDRDCQDVKRLRKKYQSLVQSIRMISCDRKNVWAQQPRKKWSVAAIGEDKQGRILFIHSRVPTSVHDLIEYLLSLKSVQLKRAMYVEGGPEAQLFINAGESRQEFVGTFKNSRPDSAGNTIAWPIPNVIGVVRKPGK